MKRIVLAFLACALLTACSSTRYQIPMHTGTPGMEGKDYVVVGETEGSAGGFLLFTVFTAIPIRKNGMLERAYKEALQKKNADFLISSTVDDFWYWTPAGNGFTVTVKGTAAKMVKSP